MWWTTPGQFTSTARATVLSGIAIAAALVGGCSGSNDSEAPGGSSKGTGTVGSPSEGGDSRIPGAAAKLNVVTTCAMVTDIVRVVGGDRTNVEGLIGEGIDPHLFTAGRNDVQKLLAADVVFYSGLMLEGRMADDFARVGRKGKPVFPVTESIDREKLREPPEFEGHWDPHVWMDVALWSECVNNVAAEFRTLDEARADEFDARAAESEVQAEESDAQAEESDARAESDAAANHRTRATQVRERAIEFRDRAVEFRALAVEFRVRADEYRKQLAELDDYIRKVVSTIPKEQRYLITAHDAFGYFSKSYGIEVKAIQGISTDSQAAISDINSLVDFIVENKVPAIFVESSVSKKNIEAVIEGCGERGWKIRIGAELYSDAMGKPGTYEGSYIGMMDHNATKIARALGGEAPEKGWQGKLAAEH